jgi:DNA-binding NarL/FixJ family response regulator
VKTRVFIADDHGIMRGGLRALINAQPDMEVIGEAADGASAQAAILAGNPDVVVIDISMPGQGGLDTVVAVRQRRPMIRMLVLTVHDEQGYVHAALRAGALGYVVKSAVDSELLAAVRAVSRGRTFMDVAVDGNALADRSTRGANTAALDQLSDREREVLRLVAEGYTNREAAKALVISVKSVETYRGRVMEKLGLTTRAELVRFALECGFLAPGKCTV